MEQLLKKIDRQVQLDGELMTVDELLQIVHQGQEVSLFIPSKKDQKLEQNSERILEQDFERENKPKAGLIVGSTYVFKVRQYMTKPSTPEFDFQSKWNNNEPMPFRIMQGRVIKETPGMVKMDCKAVPMKTDICMRCGRRLTHPVSRLYGIGPECGGHAHINPFQTEEELYSAIDKVKEQLGNITWTGWVIKSAIEEHEEVNN